MEILVFSANVPITLLYAASRIPEKEPEKERSHVKAYLINI